MQVVLNGETHSIEDGTTIIELLRSANVPENYLAVEVNDDVVPRELHTTHQLRAGDRIEVVTLVGGG